ncbi:MAG: FAD/NAD(P)-binding protein [Magnetococcales bacterium]|nr:FAD/NAD(P)-binding protein [Magnetococcales bacterium]MBF0151389.1 FAD/NAD(P)-binding protein [Magnetococcales bacterium]MBF0174355.1 FAD/NAD(P)-binding protein [Magnetococcales bacterium]MBF0348314.1 FAD/NAD(P)-binding protein [Magnetococcales bacterium]MBF0631565.1 FAD/NAD(P)-binding protein [Magnetococcales bacterium]
MNMMPTESGKVFDPKLHLPRMAQILEVTAMTAREKYFRIALPQPLGHRPGQFVMLSRLGIGEAPISISCGPRNDNILELVIRKAGRLTRVLHRLKPGQSVGIRGPFGSGFDLSAFEGQDVVCIVGGLGLAPLRSLIQPLLAQPQRFGRITLISGCRTPAEELYRDELHSWERMHRESGRVTVIRLVDKTDNLPWNGQVGLVTAPIADLALNPERTLVALCGPPVMYKFVIMELMARNIPASRIYVDLERRMRCGVGRCGHCQINHAYCCQEGPVFRFDRVGHLQEALQ